MSSVKVLLVGSGLTGSLIGALLKRSLVGCEVMLWDKARGAGGRMSTSRSPTDASCVVDLGAQYITALPKYLQSHHEYYNELLTSKVIEPLTARVEGMKDFPAGTRHFVAPEGMSSVVKHFLAVAGYPVEFQQHVSAIHLQDDSRGWSVHTKDGRCEEFDVVILTMPVPQILQLPGHIEKIIHGDSALTNALKKVTYSSRYALCLFYDSSTEFPKLEWDAKYMWNHEIFRFVSVDNKKRNRGDCAISVLFHTSVDFGLDNLEKSITEVEPVLLHKVNELFPDWPQAQAVKCHKWRYSQVFEPHADAPGSATLHSRPLLLAAGDGFVHSNVDGCIESALAATKTIMQALNCNYN